jgi:acyl-CoA thioester hydrolase
LLALETRMRRLRDDPASLRLETYPQVIELRASYADVDSFQHLNNVAMARFFEEGRATMNMSAFGEDAVVRPSSGLQLLLASVSIDYVSQGQYPGTVQVGTGVSRLGRSSFRQTAGLFQDRRCIALCEAVTVCAFGGKGADLPAHARAALERLVINPTTGETN